MVSHGTISVFCMYIICELSFTDIKLLVKYMCIMYYVLHLSLLGFCKLIY